MFNKARQILVAFAVGLASVMGCDNIPSHEGGTGNPTYTLVGTWQTRVVEQGRQMDIIWHARPDGTTTYLFTDATGSVELHGTWELLNGVLYETSAQRVPCRGSVRWVNQNSMIITIIENGNPASRGMQRHYRRM